ncbi:tagaturonate epimerase family protein [Planctomyces sp. SH-PL14]|uniref:tagaturonate epimerase family protein n=1 Tax=Planctomyces sp. SH-PL14 TaxID=1632864 RepID=UPI00078C9A93|nr:tagaturonate epimerase family protein [Planctomyces sp. SH-PL14]AMV16305.1 hypothetical protein VT03_00345 [Planctomyces sp. SH-PL14]
MTPVTLGLAPSFGFGDRTGLGTPGHVAAMQQSGSGIEPIFPQQSIREMSRTKRTPQQVMDDALKGAEAAGWTGKTGADADHLKTYEDVEVTAAVGFTFFTIDPSGHVDQHADDYSESQVREKLPAVLSACPWMADYKDKTITLSTGTEIKFTSEVLSRAAVKYGKAIEAALDLSRHIDRVHQRLGRPYEIELSVDETEQPTTLAEHYIIAEQCVKNGMKLISLAPRYIGNFEKGVDYKGVVASLEKSLFDHAAIAQALGPYKLSLHSGSDKLSMYPVLARATKGQFHVKTAGTSYLEALRVVARHDDALFRQVIDFSRDRYEIDRATYHVSARLYDAPPSKAVPIRELEQAYLEMWEHVPAGHGFTKPGRQILHCTFGSVLTNDELGPKIKACLEAHPQTYRDVLADHFSRHLVALKQGM